jgi:hypothetical protein
MSFTYVGSLIQKKVQHLITYQSAAVPENISTSSQAPHGVQPFI